VGVKINTYLGLYAVAFLSMGLIGWQKGNWARTPMVKEGLMDEQYWPARHVAEYIYCPRLFYYMQVEGIFLPSLDTEKGKTVHQRVDHPTTWYPNETDDHPKVVHSLVISSAKWELTATLDLADIQGKRAIPIEYRKGHPQQDDDTFIPWPTDRIQVGLQGILLEEAGYEVSEAMIYYAAEKRRIRIPYDDALKQEALAILEQAKQCAMGPRPAPLIKDKKCMRCSLQSICLPDEIHCIQSGDSSPALPRATWPLRDDGLHVVSQTEGTKIGFSDGALHIKGRDGAICKKIPLADMESLTVLGGVQLSTQALHALAARGIPIGFFSLGGRCLAMIDPLDTVSALVRREQVRCFDQPDRLVALAQDLIVAKIKNQRTFLMRNHPDLPVGVGAEMNRMADGAKRATTLDAIRGYEGQAAAVYFKHFPGLLHPPFDAQFAANGRARRPCPDPVNAGLSLGYAMLSNECVGALRLARLEPSIGAFHTSKPGRPALALDLMEPFRPLIADSLMVTLINRGELKPSDFQHTASGVYLTESGRKVFFQGWGNRLSTEITHPVFGYRLSYRRMIQLHAKMVAAWVTGDIDRLSFLTTR